MNDIHVPYYFQSLDWKLLVEEYPPPPAFESERGHLSDEECSSLQESRLLSRVKDAWNVDFYRKRWQSAGLELGDIQTIDDITKIPTFTSDDLKKAVEDAPPFGSHHPVRRENFGEMPLKLHTSGGTTGLPRPTLFDPLALEVQGIQYARALWSQGARPGDLTQIAFTNSLSNLAWGAFWGSFHWLGGVPITTGSGVVTPSERQLQLAREYGTDGWVMFGEYALKLAEVAEDIGFALEDLHTKFIHTYLGVDVEGNLRRLIEGAWNTKVFDNYGTNEVGLVGFECVAHKGLHINEDTAYVEIVDIDNGRTLSEGEAGNIVVTSLHRRVPPIIRFNLRDRLRFLGRNECSCGLRTGMLSSFLGRTDEMVKLRGQNVFPRACQEVVSGDVRCTGEFLCVVSKVGEGLGLRDEMVIRVERRSAGTSGTELSEDLERGLHRVLGVRVEVQIVEAGELSVHTHLGGEGKVRRLLDLRPS